jgi:hypothetical protein
MRRLSSRLGTAILLMGAGMLPAATFTVTNTNDSGPGSLRQAILDANENPGVDRIEFQIPGTGVHTIRPTSILPEIFDATVDGYTQPGASPNSQMTTDDAVLLIEIDGSQTPDAGAGYDGLVAQYSTVRGLVINRFQTDIFVGGDGSRLEGCFIGTDPTGTAARSRADGVGVKAVAATLGGALPAQRNVISGNDGAGIRHNSGVVIEGNFIGLDATGTVALPNQINIDLVTEAYGSQPVLIGGPATPAGAPPGNVISGATLDGIRITLGLPGFSGEPVTILGNSIGTNASGTAAVPNGGAGVRITRDGAVNASDSVRIGGADADRNLIAYNAGAGIVIAEPGLPVSMRANSIHSNAGLGIDLGEDGVTPNVDGNPGNYPTLSAAEPIGGSTTILGTLDSVPNVIGIPIDFVSSPACDDSGHGEGATPIGSTTVNTDAGGHASFVAVLPVSIPSGTVVAARGRSSEFSACIAVATGGLPALLVSSVEPASGSSEGGTSITVGGTGFLPGASLTIGGIPAPDVEVVDSSKIRARTPALPPGRFHDVVVTNGSENSATLPSGWMSDFRDVPGDDIFHAHVASLLRSGITAGCGDGNFCRDSSVRRDQMAVFVLKGKHDVPYLPGACTPPGAYSDVPCPGTFADWIYRSVLEGIAGLCFVSRPPPPGSPPPPPPREFRFCPLTAVRRDQMAVFLLRAEHGAGYVPPACSGTFADVPCSDPLAAWIEQLAAEGITAGCGGGNYCPDRAVTRGQMAVFLTKTFDLP